jgi:phenylpyruvate tautomerase
MATFGQAAFIMDGTLGNAAFVEIRSIGGLHADINRHLSEKICKMVNESLGIPQDRIYLNFTNVEGNRWGWNGSTFG